LTQNKELSSNVPHFLSGVFYCFTDRCSRRRSGGFGQRNKTTAAGGRFFAKANAGVWKQIKPGILLTTMHGFLVTCLVVVGVHR
jgi:hypothetical protein